MSEKKRQAFYVDETMKTPNGYVPALVTEGEAGYTPLTGNGEFASPWYWGQDIETARKICVEANAKLGLSEQEAHQIVQSSITAQIREDAARERANERWENIKKGRPADWSRDR